LRALVRIEDLRPAVFLESPVNALYAERGGERVRKSPGKSPAAAMGGFIDALLLLAQGPLRATVLQIFPSWMYAGFFDLFAWQFVYVSGAAISALWKQKYSLLESSQTLLDKTSAISVILCVICFIWSRGFLPAINPPDFLISKEHVGILRYLNFMAFVGVISFIVRHKSGLLDFAFTATLGKHSLEVYSAHTVCVYLWLATPNPIQGHLPFNLLAPIFCCFILWIIAKLLEKKGKIFSHPILHCV